MTTRMLIDARHREETRVAVIKGNRIEELDFESAEHKQIKGNIYLAKVIRVEPSLQAAFVEYGGNRHGFLAFAEIHPDYYQIPKEDRDALLREEAEYSAAEAAMRAEEEIESLEGEVEDVQPPAPLGDEDDFYGAPDRGDDSAEDDGGDDNDAEESSADGQYDELGEGDENSPGDNDSDQNGSGESGYADNRGRGRGRRRGRSDGQANTQARSDRDDARDFRRSLHRRYKIQDVIRRRQVLLVQVVKEERGGKGAALTSYLSLAGRYCVLMPNSSHGGGISRKIANGADRKRLKTVIDDLGLPPTMGCIVRTAGLERTKTEIKRDFDYLARLWDDIREQTLKSEAPALIHSDSDLIKRAIRDIYNNDISEVSVEGDEGYRAAKDFMKLLMPSHARKVKQYADVVPLFQRYGVEDQLGAMYQPHVTLKSGGYLVINPTEALVSIDINSGRSTREHNIEQTAYNTNLEAAYEIARQLRLRDMAGLVVIDFIDMDQGNHVRKIERAMRDALKNDRARIQVGRISGFGLMEMSRQRLRTGVLEASTRACPHCEGTGLVRTASSAGLSALRLLEEEAARGRGSLLVLRTSQEATIYVLNNKRAELSEIETRYGVKIEVQPDNHVEGARMSVEASGPPPENMPRFEPIIDEDDEPEDALPFAEDGDEEEDERPARNHRRREEGSEGEQRRRGRRRRGGRGRDRNDQPREGSNEAAQDEQLAANDGGDSDSDAQSDRGGAGDSASGEAGAEGDAARRRRRGRRGGRGRRNVEGDVESENPQANAPDDAVAETEAAPVKPKRVARSRKAEADKASDSLVSDDAVPVAAAPADEAAPAKPKRASRARKAAPALVVETSEQAVGEEKPKRTSRARKVAENTAEAPSIAAGGSDGNAVANDTGTGSDAVSGETEGEGGTRRRGWWQSTFGPK
ncbi:MAG: Rne/Rng family ribonuclease [Sphingopyxis sp.]